MHSFARNVASSQPFEKFLDVLKSLEPPLSDFFELVLLTPGFVASQRVTKAVDMIDLPVMLLLGARSGLETLVVHGVPQLQGSAAGYNS